MRSNDNTYPLLRKLQTVCLKQNIPFVSYRLPLQKGITTLVQHRSFPEKLDMKEHLEQKNGFMIVPFSETAQHGSFLLYPDDIFHSDNIDPDYLEHLSRNTHFLSTEKPTDEKISTTPSVEFIRQVEEAKQAMMQDKFHKVVLSKIRIENLPQDFQASTFFLQLCDKYPHAFVYIVQLPEVGCWIGATPEPLAVIEEGRVRTVSLAGTQLSTGEKIDSYSWSGKETEEQGIVTAYVEQSLQSLKIDNYSLDGPMNYQAANLIHLKTGFEFDQTELGNRLGVFLRTIHPTPSVGGLPKKAAFEFISAHEKHDRAYYTGFLGPLNIENESHLFVNLRCLQLFRKNFVLYSGAGITAASVAEREWEETDNKMMTMMNVMKSS